MPVVPHYPSDEPTDEEAPDLDDLVGRILGGGDDPFPRPTGARALRGR